MTNVTAHTALKKEWCQECLKVILRQNVHPNNQLHNGKGGGHYALFSVMLCPLHTITNEEQYDKCLCN